MPYLHERKKANKRKGEYTDHYVRSSHDGRYSTWQLLPGGMNQLKTSHPELYWWRLNLEPYKLPIYEVVELIELGFLKTKGELEK